MVLKGIRYYYGIHVKGRAGCSTICKCVCCTTRAVCLSVKGTRAKESGVCDGTSADADHCINVTHLIVYLHSRPWHSKIAFQSSGNSEPKMLFRVEKEKFEHPVIRFIYHGDGTDFFSCFCHPHSKDFWVVHRKVKILDQRWRVLWKQLRKPKTFWTNGYPTCEW